MTTNRNSKNKTNKDAGAGAPKNFMIPVLLLHLKNWNAHGYELMQQLTQFGFQSVDKGNFYRIMRQLEKDELVISKWDTSSSGPAKRIYSITSAGEEYLDTWANSLEQYQKMLDQFFRIYSNFWTPGFTAKDDDENN